MKGFSYGLYKRLQEGHIGHLVIDECYRAPIRTFVWGDPNGGDHPVVVCKNFVSSS